LHLPDTLVRFAQVLVEDDDLRLWFDRLADVPPGVRAAEFKSMAARMQEADYPAELTHATALLAAPGMYEALKEAVDGLL
jgi:hypothetical protein